MAFGDVVYSAITITCVCYSGEKPEPKGLYAYHVNKFPFYTFCAHPAIQDSDLEGLQRPALYKTVWLSGCVPLNTSYEEPLQFLGTKPLNVLGLILNEKLPRLTNRSFHGMMSLPEDLRLISTRDVVVPEAGTLSNLNTVHYLTLYRVRPDSLPNDLNSLYIKNAGYRELPSEALNAVHITLNEALLDKISGEAPRLKTLTVMAPLTEMPWSSTLEELTVIRTLLRTMPLYSSLRKLEIRQHHQNELHWAFLKGFHNLTSFKLVQSRFTELPNSLFYNLKELREIDLSENLFESIPSFQTSHLPNMETLKMSSNRLRVIRFNLLPWGALRTLDLSDNPLGDVCLNNSDVMKLQNLTTLNLSRTGAKEICVEWLTSLKHLQTLKVSHNNISRLSCALLRTARGSNDSVVEIDLTGNQLDVTCSADDYIRVLQSQKQLKVKTTGDFQTACSCDAYWLIRLQRDFAQFTPSPPLAQCSANITRECYLRMRCRPEAETRCKVSSYGDYVDVYIVEGQNHTIQYDDGNFFNMSCAAVSLDGDALLAFPWPVRFQNVFLHGCRPPNRMYKSYYEALNALNVTIGENFFLYDLQPNSVFTSTSFDGLTSLKHLHLEAVDKNQVLVVASDLLSNVKPISSLHLNKVYSDEVPASLTRLELTDTGFTTLPRGALDVINLTIRERNITSLSGLSTRLQQLSITAPMKTLLNATSLTVLELNDAQPAAGFAETCPQLQSLALHRLMLLLLPQQFLRGAAQLRHFELTHNSLHTLPIDLFEYSRYLTSINLADNKLEHLSANLLSGLDDLVTLNLDHNRLTFNHIPDLRVLVNLRNFSINGNFAD